MFNKRNEIFLFYLVQRHAHVSVLWKKQHGTTCVLPLFISMETVSQVIPKKKFKLRKTQNQGNSLGTFAGFKTRTSWFTGLGKNKKKKWDSGFSFSPPPCTTFFTEESLTRKRTPKKGALSDSVV